MCAHECAFIFTKQILLLLLLFDFSSFLLLFLDAANVASFCTNRLAFTYFPDVSFDSLCFLQLIICTAGIFHLVLVPSYNLTKCAARVLECDNADNL